MNFASIDSLKDSISKLGELQGSPLNFYKENLQPNIIILSRLVTLWRTCMKDYNMVQRLVINFNYHELPKLF